MYKTGKYEQGLKLVQELQKPVDTIDYLPVKAEVLYSLGTLSERVGEYKKAETILKDAALAAGESRDSLLAAKIMTQLVWIVGYSV